MPAESWYTFHVVSIGNVPVMRPPSQQLSALASKYTGYGMAVDGAHDAASALTRSFGLSVVVKRDVCAPVIVRVGDAEHGPAAPPVAGRDRHEPAGHDERRDRCVSRHASPRCLPIRVCGHPGPARPPARGVRWVDRYRAYRPEWGDATDFSAPVAEAQATRRRSARRSVSEVPPHTPCSCEFWSA